MSRAQSSRCNNVRESNSCTYLPEARGYVGGLVKAHKSRSGKSRPVVFAAVEAVTLAREDKAERSFGTHGNQHVREGHFEAALVDRQVTLSYSTVTLEFQRKRCCTRFLVSKMHSRPHLEKAWQSSFPTRPLPSHSWSRAPLIAATGLGSQIRRPAGPHGVTENARQ